MVARQQLPRGLEDLGRDVRAMPCLRRGESVNYGGKRAGNRKWQRVGETES